MPNLSSYTSSLEDAAPGVVSFCCCDQCASGSGAAGSVRPARASSATGDSRTEVGSGPSIAGSRARLRRKETVMKHPLNVLLVTIVVLSLAAAAWAAEVTATPSSSPEKLGRVLFKTSCSPEAQKQFERALATLHSFFFPETIKAFSSIPQTDPSCAIAYWGLAVSIRPNPLVGPFDAATLKRGLEAVEKGKAIGAKTQRERDWLAAIEEFWKDYDKGEQATRTKNYEKAMEALVQKYPDDVEAKIFYALALNETFDHKTMANLEKAIQDPGTARQEVSGPSRHHPLLDPQL